MRRSFFALFLAVSSSGLAAWRKVGDAQATFHGSGPAGFKIEGKSKELILKDDGTTLTLTVPLDNLDTEIGLRNKHMKEKYLETEKFPHAVLTVPLASVKFPEDGQTSEGEAPGNFTVHGKSKATSVKYKIKRVGSNFLVEGNFPVNLKGHDIQIPSYLGVTVKPDLTARAVFTAQKD